MMPLTSACVLQSLAHPTAAWLGNGALGFRPVPAPRALGNPRTVSAQQTASKSTNVTLSTQLSPMQKLFDGYNVPARARVICKYNTPVQYSQVAAATHPQQCIPLSSVIPTVMRPKGRCARQPTSMKSGTVTKGVKKDQHTTWCRPQ